MRGPEEETGDTGRGRPAALKLCLAAALLTFALCVPATADHPSSTGLPDVITAASPGATSSSVRSDPQRPTATVSAAMGESARYALAGGCYGLRSASAQRFAAKAAAGGYAATAGPVGAAEPFRMQATALGSYLFYGKQADFLAGDAASAVRAAPAASPAADWRVDVSGGAFRIALPSAGKVLAVGSGGRLVLVADNDASAATKFTFEKASGCARYPEVDVNAVGAPTRGATSYGEVSGLLDAHMHMMAFEFLGGRAHCGRPWHAYGVTSALVDCPDHYPNGAGAILENAISFGNPAHTHDPVGWPTFKDWPNHKSLTHEQSYYRWLERSWQGGLRVFVNLLVENKVLCEIYPYKQNSCNEMDAVRLQARRIHELENYIDAQSGGPGKGFFRIVTDPFQARRVINSGKLAVVLGIEVSEPFDCQVYNDQPQCDAAQIDRDLGEVYRLGVRDMEIVNKFDNALAGVAGDNGTTGAIVNNGNKLETGKYWQMQKCTGPPEESDRGQLAAFGHNNDDIIGNGLGVLLPPGIAPIYPSGPQCNARGLTALGEHAIRALMDKRMIIDPDHLSVLARKQVLSLLEARRYSGVVSSHSWSTPDVWPRIYNLGGVIAPYAGSSVGFVKAWREIRPKRNPRFYFGFGWGADMNGFGAQGGPRAGANPVQYPFRSFDGKVTLDRQRSGQRVFDINKDGVAHYGLYPDWVQDLRNIAGDQIARDLGRGAEAYLQMWERADGIPGPHCRTARGRFTHRGLNALRLGYSTARLLRRAGQPLKRGARTWRYCVRSDRLGRGKAVAVLSPGARVALVGSDAVVDRVLKIGRGASARRLRGSTRPFGSGILIGASHGGSRFVYGVRRGRVRFIAVATRTATANPSRLRSYLRLGGLG